MVVVVVVVVVLLIFGLLVGRVKGFSGTWDDEFFQENIIKHLIWLFMILLEPSPYWVRVSGCRSPC